MAKLRKKDPDAPYEKPPEVNLKNGTTLFGISKTDEKGPYMASTIFSSKAAASGEAPMYEPCDVGGECYIAKITILNRVKV